MSFAQSVKRELAAIRNENVCCTRAQAYGLLLFGRQFSQSRISLLTENKETADSYIGTCLYFTGLEPKRRITKSGKYIVGFDNKQDIELVMSSFGHTPSDLSLRIYRSNLENECCYNAFLRGVFMSCGTVADPEKHYHLEFVVPYFQLSKDLFKVMEDMDLSPKMTSRNGNHILYFKDSENIEEVLTSMGATNCTLELMGIKMMKDVRNKINRKVNFETANISRTVEASMAQIRAIEKIRDKRGLDSLSPQLEKIARFRLEHPDMSLDELRTELDEGISRSGVNHRLNKLIQIASEISD